MRFGLSKCGVLVLLAAVLGYAMCSGVASPAAGPLLTVSPRVTFGQSIAISDLDGDDAVDQATLGAVGFRKSIRISLSSTPKPSLLQFTTSSYGHGSLFAYDIDNDGYVDLVWSDLIHPEDVVVWLNDGSGRFERRSYRCYADGFVVGGQKLTGVYSQTRELGVNQPPSNSLDQSGAGQSWLYGFVTPVVSRTNQPRESSPACRVLADRGPPAFHC